MWPFQPVVGGGGGVGAGGPGFWAKETEATFLSSLTSFTF